MGDTPNTDEQRLAEFSQKLDSFKPEGFDEEKFTAFKEAVIGYHKNDIQGLKINSAQMKEEKQAIADKNKSLESALAAKTAELEELQKKLADSQPDELRKHYENQQAQLNDVFAKKESDYQSQIEAQNKKIAEYEQGILERDVMTEFNKCASTKNWLGGGRELAEKFICGPHGTNFSRLSMGDGTSILVNEAKQDMSQALEKFCETDVGKNLLASGSTGGGADGSASTTGTGKRLTQAEYDALSPQDRMDFDIDGGQIV